MPHDHNAEDGLQAVDLLLVDDDDFEAKMVTRAFRGSRIGNRIVRAEDGRMALDILTGRHELTVSHPSILLVDLNMPRMNGLEFLQEIRADARLRKLVAFILTTSNDERDKAAAYDLNVAGYIVKQNAGTDFRKLVMLLEDYWATVQLPQIA